MLRKRQQSPSSTSRVGSAVVETALVMPIFLSLVLGVVEFGRAMMVANLLTNAATDGARMAISTGVSASDVQSAVIQEVQKTIGLTLSTADIVITVVPYPGNPDPLNEPLNARTRDLCNVIISTDYKNVALVTKFLKGARLRGQAAMRHE